jgi:hypothetical protein
MEIPEGGEFALESSGAPDSGGGHTKFEVWPMIIYINPYMYVYFLVYNK